ncbi:MAG TPA: hypothetical protein VHM00_08610 [Caldimonas sp.]|nr:hypothetical protein [Caldimonas sp.]HEX2541129.1 hypothetical protein [Caldimonas sp.]
MSPDGSAEARAGFWSSLASLLASSSTLVCCALPALLVAVGAGAALSSLVSFVPQLVWLSEHKEALFLAAGAMLAATAVVRWRYRNAPCPADPALRRACLRTRVLSSRVFAFSVAVYAVGAWFAFALPAMSG